MSRKLMIPGLLTGLLGLYPFTWHLVCIDTVRGSGAYGTDIEVDGSGYPHIIYKEIYDLGLIYCHWDGSQWIYEAVQESLGVKIKGTSGSISLELDDKGYPHIGNTGGPAYIWKDNAGWHRESGIDPGTHDIDWVSLRLDSKGYPHMAYNDKYEIGADEYTSVRYCYKDSSGWHVEVVVWADPSKVSVGEYGVSLVLDSLDLPHIIYSWDDDTSQFEFKVAYAYKDTSGVWHKEYFDTSNVWAHYPNVDIDDSGRVVVVYGFGGGTPILRYGVRDTNGIWDCEWVEDTTKWAGYIGFYIDSSGGKYISYALGNSLKVAWDTSGIWETECIDSIYSGMRTLTSFGIVRDRYGYLHISYSPSLGGSDDNTMWYATTNGLIGIEEEIKDVRIDIPSIVYGSVLRVTVPDSDGEIRMYDIAGREVEWMSVDSERVFMDVSGLGSGVYFLRLSGRIYRVTIIR